MPLQTCALPIRSEEHTSELQHTIISYAVFCLKKEPSQTHPPRQPPPHQPPPPAPPSPPPRRAPPRARAPRPGRRSGRSFFFLKQPGPPKTPPLPQPPALPI